MMIAMLVSLKIVVACHIMFVGQFCISCCYECWLSVLVDEYIMLIGVRRNRGRTSYNCFFARNVGSNVGRSLKLW